MMKKFLTIFALIAFISMYETALPQQLSFRFANYEVINAGTQLQFDVEVKASVAGTFHRDLQIYFDYNTAAFGTDIVTAGTISYTPLTLMNASKYTVVNMADNTSSKFAIITEAMEEMVEPGSSTYYEEVTTTYQGLLQFTIDILPGTNTEMCGISFDHALMNGGQYYQSTSLPVAPLKYADPSAYEGDISTLKLSTLYGTISYANVGSTPISSCTVDGGGIGTALTDVNGFYNFSGINDGSYTLTTTCSLPWENASDIDDINLMIDHILGTVLTGVNFLAADVSWDAIVDIDDINLIIDNVLGVPYPFASPEWVFLQQTVNVVNGIGTVDYDGLCAGDANGSYNGSK